MGELLSREQILHADDRRYEIVSVPEWGGDVRLRALSGGERDDFEAKSIKGKGQNEAFNRRNIRARLVAMCAIDDAGAPLFPNPADVLRLSSKNAAALERLFESCQRLCGMTDRDVEELEQGFGEAQPALSISD